MPLLEGNAVVPGLKKPEIPSGVDGKKKLLYSPNYFTIHPKPPDVGESSPPWNSLKASLLDGRSPACHLSGPDRRSALVYRQDERSSHEGHSNPPRMCHTPAKQGFALYTRSPRVTPRAPTTLAVKRHKNENSSPGFENSVYLSIPKPVYGQNPCCHELGCGLGARYEHGLQRIPNAFYEHEWMQNASRYPERVYIPRKEQAFESRPEQIKKLNTDTSGKARKVPAVDPGFNNYPFIPTHTFLSPLSESGQQLHTPLGCQSRFPSHATYEGMTSEMYQESSPLSKYGPLTHHPLVYYPPAHVEIENRHLYKEMDSRRRDELKNTLLTSRDQTRVAPLHAEIPVHHPSSEGLPHHPFNPRIEYPYPYYAVPRYHLPQSQIALTRPRPSPPSYVNVPLSQVSQASVTLSSNKNKLDADPSQASSSFHHAEQASYAHHPAVSPSNPQLQRLVPPFTTLHLDRAVFPTASHNGDYCESRVHSPKTPQDSSCPSPSWFPSPTSSSEPKPNSPGDNPTPNATLLKQLLKRSHSNASSSVDLDETGGMDLRKKLIKIEVEDDVQRSRTSSPPMPVIDNVFSLAPYRALMGLRCEPPASPQHREIKPKLCIKKERMDSPCHAEDLSAEKPVNEVSEVKAEPQSSDKSKDEGNKSVKHELDDPEILRVQVVDKCETLDLELKSPEEEKESKPAVDDVNPSSQGEKYFSPVLVLAPKIPESKPTIKDNPPNPPSSRDPSDSQHYPFIGYREKMLHQMVELTGTPKPIRKNFLELHRSVCKLVSTFVSTSSVEKLRQWLSRLQMTELPSSLTKAKVSQLLGAKARREWLDQDLDDALEKVQERLREYSFQHRFPFPHVMRAGSVFLPMLVVKEVLFPMVQGRLIDQVLQEHKVELRPSTLSEEKFLIQCDKRASSSKLRRLMSLKHLPKVYADVFNLVYYTHVCKHIESTSPDVEKKVQVHVTVMGSRRILLLSPERQLTDGASVRRRTGDVSAPPGSKVKPEGARRTKSRIKRRSRLLFLDDSWSDGDAATGSGLGSVEPTTSWMCPMTLDDLSSSPADAEPGSRPATPKLPHMPKKGMILKLRRMFCGGADSTKAHYEAVSDSDDLQVFGGEVRPGEDRRGVASDGRHRWKRRDFHKTPRPLDDPSPRRLLKIKYCPFLSTCHSADRRRRWVLRSAVKTARGATGPYPDLVGRRIRHLYEEDDKTEVWYRGEVVRVHEAHADPLKTVYEVRYDSEPGWTYYLELLLDYRKGWIQMDV